MRSRHPRARSLLVAAFRVALGLLAAAAIFVTVARASSLIVGTKSLGANRASVSRCDTDGLSVQHVLSGSNIVSVSVGQISAACAGGSLSVAVNNGTANSTGSTAVPAGGGSVSVTLASPVAMKDSVEIDVAIAGP